MNPKIYFFVERAMFDFLNQFLEKSFKHNMKTMQDGIMKHSEKLSEATSGPAFFNEIIKIICNKVFDAFSNNIYLHFQNLVTIDSDDVSLDDIKKLNQEDIRNVGLHVLYRLSVYNIMETYAYEKLAPFFIDNFTDSQHLSLNESLSIYFPNYAGTDDHAYWSDDDGSIPDDWDDELANEHTMYYSSSSSSPDMLTPSQSPSCSSPEPFSAGEASCSSSIQTPHAKVRSSLLERASSPLGLHSSLFPARSVRDTQTPSIDMAPRTLSSAK